MSGMGLDYNETLPTYIVSVLALSLDLRPHYTPVSTHRPTAKWSVRRVNDVCVFVCRAKSSFGESGQNMHYGRTW